MTQIPQQPTVADPGQRFAIYIPTSADVGTVAGNLQIISTTVAKLSLPLPMKIPEGWVCDMLTASVPYSQPNIGAAVDLIPGYASGNDRISINFNAGGRTDYILPQGLYGYTDVSAALNNLAYDAGWVTTTTSGLFTLFAITATQKLILQVDPAPLTGGAFPAGGIVIDFLNPSVASINNSIGPVMGWPTSGGSATLTIAGAGTAPVTFEAPNIADFAITSSYLFFMSWLADSRLNGAVSQVLEEFSLGGQAPNSVMSFRSTLPTGPSLQPGIYSSITFGFTDQSGNPLKFVNFQAPVSITMKLRPAAVYSWQLAAIPRPEIAQKMIAQQDRYTPLRGL